MSSKIQNITEYQVFGRTPLGMKLLKVCKNLQDAFKTSDNLYNRDIKNIKIIKRDYEVKSKVIFEIETRKLQK